MVVLRFSIRSGVTALALGLSALLSASAVAQEAGGQQSPQVGPAEDASYVEPGGAIYVVGDDRMGAMLARLNELFAKTHPGVKFKMLLKGSSTALGALTAGVSAFAPMDREAWPLELRPFRQVYGYEPTDIHIGHDGYAAPGRISPPGIYVNAGNPLSGLTVEEVARIFTTGGGSGDLTQWAQLGVKGEWAHHAIHVYGPRDDGGFATSIRHSRMGGHYFTRRYEPLSSDAEIVQAVAEDRYGIALLGFFDSRKLPRLVRMVPLAPRAGEAYSTGCYDDVLAGRYAYAPFLHLYVNRAPGKPLDSFVTAYVRLALSKEGQAILAGQKEMEEGYVPLNATEVAAELAKLE